MSNDKAECKTDSAIEAALDNYISAARKEELAVEAAMMRIAKSDAAIARGSNAVDRYAAGRQVASCSYCSSGFFRPSGNANEPYRFGSRIDAQQSQNAKCTDRLGAWN